MAKQPKFTVRKEVELTELSDLVNKPTHPTQHHLSSIKSDGGPTSYYDFLTNWNTLNDYIEYKSEHQWGADSYHLANITKAGCRWGDKEGTGKVYDSKKIVYSALRILRRLSGPKEVQTFLEKLKQDAQFKE